MSNARSRRAAATLGLVVVLALGGCGGRAGGASTAFEPCGPGRVLRLYLGRSSPAGPVDDAAVAAFLDAEVAPRFADGFTVYAARGAWRGADGAVEREDTVVVEIATARPGDERARAESVAQRWKERFHQEAVLLTETSATVEIR